ncbi:MAG: hypothetical protein ACUVYA_21595 [Planctomycetota bacterium]
MIRTASERSGRRGRARGIAGTRAGALADAAGWGFAILLLSFASPAPLACGERAASPEDAGVRGEALEEAKPEAPAAGAPSEEAERKALRAIQEASAGEEGPVLRKAPPRAPREKARARPKSKAARPAPAEPWPEPVPGWSGYPWAWGWYPWYPAPQTYRPPHEHPPSITHVPRLGLSYNYPYAYQMGIRVPDDSSPLEHAPNLGPFQGVVQKAKEELRREEEAAQLERVEAARGAIAQLCDRAVALMKEKEFRRAGRILTEAFAAADDPAIPLLLSEVLFALEKPLHAEALLRHALKAPGAQRALPDSIAAHFPSAEDFEERLSRLEAKSEGADLLVGYLLVHSRRPERGAEALRKLAVEKPDDKAAALLYRRYLRAILPEGEVR